VFITNAVLCNPRDENGNNSTPTVDEIDRCATHLKGQLELVDPRIVVTLGASALKALSVIEPHILALQSHVRTAQQWLGRTLIPLYHPGQRAMIHRSFANQLADYRFIAEQAARLESPQARVTGRPKLDVARVAYTIIRSCRELSYFALHKLLYLCEVAHVKEAGVRMTSGYFIRQKDGPYCVDLHPHRLKKAIPALQLFSRGGRLMVRLGTEGLFEESSQSLTLPEITAQTVDLVVQRYSGMTDAELKTRAYLTSPMRKLLREERATKIGTFNAPIDIH
jgi:hypothetical protein